MPRRIYQLQTTHIGWLIAGPLFVFGMSAGGVWISAGWPLQAAQLKLVGLFVTTQSAALPVVVSLTLSADLQGKLSADSFVPLLDDSIVARFGLLFSYQICSYIFMNSFCKRFSELFVC